MVSETNHRAVGHHDVIEPLGGLHIRGRLPDAECTTARTRALKVHELYLCLAPRFVQGRAYAVMPFANDAGRRLHNVVDLERSVRTAVSARRHRSRLPWQGSCSSHDLASLRFPGAPVCTLAHARAIVRMESADRPVAPLDRRLARVARGWGKFPPDRCWCSWVPRSPHGPGVP
jgi:hypothetical protein